jgi:hypothetical protein
MPDHPPPGHHVWFNLGYDHQCGVCGAFFKVERERLAKRCDVLGMPDVAAAIRAAEKPKAARDA